MRAEFEQPATRTAGKKIQYFAPYRYKEGRKRKGDETYIEIQLEQAKETSKHGDTQQRRDLASCLGSQQKRASFKRCLEMHTFLKGRRKSNKCHIE